MRTEKDYEEFFTLLNKHDVKYCIVGSHALAFHARPRYTKDVVILIEARPENARKILAALDEFGFGALELTLRDFLAEENIIQLGYEPVRIDIMTSLKGIEFKDIWETRIQAPYGAQTVKVISREYLIKAKRLSNRTQEKADLEQLLASSE